MVVAKFFYHLVEAVQTFSPTYEVKDYTPALRAQIAIDKYLICKQYYVLSKNQNVKHVYWHVYFSNPCPRQIRCDRLQVRW